MCWQSSYCDPQVLLRLNSTSPNPLPNFNQTIDNYKNSPIDPSAEQRIKTITEQWRGMERGLESEMFQIRRDVCETKKDVREIKLDVEDTKKHVEIIKKDIQNIKQGKSYCKIYNFLQRKQSVFGCFKKIHGTY